MFGIGRGKKRKNQEGYYQGTDSKGRVSWKKIVQAASDIPFQDLVNAQNDYVQAVDAAAAAYYSGNRQQTAQMWKRAAEIKSAIRSIGEFGMALDDEGVDIDQWSQNYEEFRKGLGLDIDHDPANLTSFKYSNAFVSQEELAEVADAIEESLDQHRGFSDMAGVEMGEAAGDDLQVIISDEGVFLKNAQDNYAAKIDEESEWVFHSDGRVEKNPHFSGAPSDSLSDQGVRYKTFKRTDDNGRVFVESIPVDKQGNPLVHTIGEDTHPDTLEFPPQHPESHMRRAEDSEDTIQFSSVKNRDEEPPLFSPRKSSRIDDEEEEGIPVFRSSGSGSQEKISSPRKPYSGGNSGDSDTSQEKISSPRKPYVGNNKNPNTGNAKKNRDGDQPQPDRGNGSDSTKPYSGRKENSSSTDSTKGKSNSSPNPKSNNNNSSSQEGGKPGGSPKGRRINYEDRRTNPRSVQEAEEEFDSFGEHEFVESRQSFERRARADRKRRKAADNRERGLLHAAEAATGMGQFGRFRPSTPQRIGPFKIYFGRQFPKPSSLHISLGFFSFRLWSATHRAGISSMNVLPGYMHFRFNPKAKDRLEEGSKQRRSRERI